MQSSLTAYATQGSVGPLVIPIGGTINYDTPGGTFGSAIVQNPLNKSEFQILQPGWYRVGFDVEPAFVGLPPTGSFQVDVNGSQLQSNTNTSLIATAWQENTFHVCAVAAPGCPAVGAVVTIADNASFSVELTLGGSWSTVYIDQLNTNP
jgi:hypothetical protein